MEREIKEIGLPSGIKVVLKTYFTIGEVNDSLLFPCVAPAKGRSCARLYHVFMDAQTLVGLTVWRSAVLRSRPSPSTDDDVHIVRQLARHRFRARWWRVPPVEKRK